MQVLLGAAPAALARAGSTVRRFFELAASVAVIPIYLFFLLESNRDYVGDLRGQLSFLRPNVRQDLVFLATEFAGIMVSFFRGQLLIGLIMGVLKAVGFTIIGVQGGLILGFLFGMMNVVPYLGTILGLTVILPIAYFQADGGGLELMFKALGVFVVVQMCEAYFITPKVMGKRTGLHPMVIIFSIFFWGQALHGLLGVLLAVPLTAFLVVVWRLLKSKYLPRHGVTTVPFVKPPT
jgi:predicted PurR-regulated permease PerM